MTDLEAIKARITEYAGYDSVDARHEVDKQVRAWLGEALSVARVRLAPAGAVAERLDGLILRCEFSDQRVVRAADHALFDQALLDRVHALDRELLDIADRLRTLDETKLGVALDDAARVLDERYGALADAKSE